MLPDYRTADHTDIPALLELGIRSYQTHEAVLGEDAWETMRTSLSRPRLYEDLLDKATGFVCEAGQRLAGMVFLVPSGVPSAHFPIEWAHIRLLGIAPEYRRQGISRRLMEHCIAAARDTGEHTLGLHTGGFMHGARRLYRELGFVADSELPPIFDQPYTRFRLAL